MARKRCYARQVNIITVLDATKSITASQLGYTGPYYGNTILFDLMFQTTSSKNQNPQLGFTSGA